MPLSSSETVLLRVILPTLSKAECPAASLNSPLGTRRPLWFQLPKYKKARTKNLQSSQDQEAFLHTTNSELWIHEYPSLQQQLSDLSRERKPAHGHFFTQLHHFTWCPRRVASWLLAAPVTQCFPLSIHRMKPACEGHIMAFFVILAQVPDTHFFKKSK